MIFEVSKSKVNFKQSGSGLGTCHSMKVLLSAPIRPNISHSQVVSSHAQSLNVSVGVKSTSVTALEQQPLSAVRQSFSYSAVKVGDQQMNSEI